MPKNKAPLYGQKAKAKTTPIKTKFFIVVPLFSSQNA